MSYMPDPYAIKQYVNMARVELKAIHDHTFNDDYAKAYRAAMAVREHLAGILGELHEYEGLDID